MTSSPLTPASGARWWLLLAVLVAAFAMLAPGLALADDTAVADEVVATAPAAPSDGTATAGEQTPAEPVDPAPVDPAPVDQAPVEGQPTTEAPAPPPAAGETPTPPETESTPTPAPAPSSVDTAPPPSNSALPTAPDAPKAIVEPDKLPVALLAPGHVAQAAIPAAAVTRVDLDVDSSVPDAPGAPTTVAATTNEPPLPMAPVATQDAALHQDIFTLDPGQARSPVVAAVAGARLDRAPGAGLGDEGVSTLFGESVVAPVGTISSGSSLLAVLAGYVLPGVAGPPAATIIMFVLVGLIVAIARAPRPQLSERLSIGSLLGAASGHGLAVCRPG